MPRPEAILVWMIDHNERERSRIQLLLNETQQINCARSFSTCEGALSALAKEIKPDVIFLDFIFPTSFMDGIEGIQQIKNASPKTQIIVLTDTNEGDKIFQSIVAGASGYILKNSPDEIITNAVDEVLRGGVPMNPEISYKLLRLYNKLPSPEGEPKLSDMERDILHLMTDGFSKKEIAAKLHLSYRSVNLQIRELMNKFYLKMHGKAVSTVVGGRLI